MHSKWPIEEIAGVTTLRVCHAVNKPARLAAAWHGYTEVSAYRHQDAINVRARSLSYPNSGIVRRTADRAASCTAPIELDLALADSLPHRRRNGRHRWPATRSRIMRTQHDLEALRPLAGLDIRAGRLRGLRLDQRRRRLRSLGRRDGRACREPSLARASAIFQATARSTIHRLEKTEDKGARQFQRQDHSGDKPPGEAVLATPKSA